MRKGQVVAMEGEIPGQSAEMHFHRGEGFLLEADISHFSGYVYFVCQMEFPPFSPLSFPEHAQNLLRDK